uniref:Uncharacterized protein n=1 Tax=viral metagenome TaxID=1070528 RepID=A0A6C0KEN4_9ZZZZ
MTYEAYGIVYTDPSTHEKLREFLYDGHDDEIRNVTIFSDDKYIPITFDSFDNRRYFVYLTETLNAPVTSVHISDFTRFLEFIRKFGDIEIGGKPCIHKKI